jgi:hypothetical protein
VKEKRSFGKSVIGWGKLALLPSSAILPPGWDPFGDIWGPGSLSLRLSRKDGGVCFPYTTCPSRFSARTTHTHTHTHTHAHTCKIHLSAAAIADNPPSQPGLLSHLSSLGQMPLSDLHRLVRVV